MPKYSVYLPDLITYIIWMNKENIGDSNDVIPAHWNTREDDFLEDDITNELPVSDREASGYRALWLAVIDQLLIDAFQSGKYAMSKPELRIAKREAIAWFESPGLKKDMVEVCLNANINPQALMKKYNDIKNTYNSETETYKKPRLYYYCTKPTKAPRIKKNLRAYGIVRAKNEI